jgi:CRISPR-associated endonuclease/helicase Cas3
VDPELRELWAKSPTEEGSPGEPLVDHTQHVVRSLVGIMELRPDLPDVVGCDRLWHRTYWACCFHDLGKAASGFQRQVRKDGAIWGQRHEVLSLGFLSWLDLPDDDLLWITAAIASHHRDAAFIRERYGWDLDVEDDELINMANDVPEFWLEPLHRWLREWTNGYIVSQGLRRFGVNPVPFRPLATLDSTPEECRRNIQQFLRRYECLVDELWGRGARHQDVITGLMLRGIVISADRMGSAHAKRLEAVNLDGVDGVLRGMGRGWDELYEHQREAVHKRDVVLTAPTASGKTEAGLLWAVAQRDRVPRLLYMLPYQASINAMQARLSSYVAGQQVGLQHGRALHALYRRLLEDDPEPRRAAAIARREHNLTRLNHPPMRVLTPYQILKACYRLKGYEAILSDLVDGSVIVDEIHSYEATKLAMILSMARHLKRRLGTRWFIMSATLPTLVRDAVSEALEQPCQVRATDDLYASFRRHVLHMVSGDMKDHLDLIVKEAKGSHVLVCCNTVHKAQDIYELLGGGQKDRPYGIELLHGRLNGRDRLDVEGKVERAVPAHAGRSRGPLVVVATQVIEVSLNLSFDVIFTDPAPLDALLQRFGRVNRLPGGELRPVYVFTEPQDGQGVYSGDVVEKTVKLLRRHSGEPIDEAQIQSRIDEIYSGALADEWRREYSEALENFEWTVLDALRPFQSDDKLEDRFYKAFDSVDVLPASFEAQYDRESEEKPIEAGELLVPIRHATLGMLCQKGRARRRRDRIWIVDVPYSDTLGLRVKDV